MKREAHSFRTSSTDDTKKKKRGRGDPCWVKQARGPLVAVSRLPRRRTRVLESGSCRTRGVHMVFLRVVIATPKGIGSDEEPWHDASSGRDLHWL
jgi:hypothetical protein